LPCCSVQCGWYGTSYWDVTRGEYGLPLVPDLLVVHSALQVLGFFLSGPSEDAIQEGGPGAAAAEDSIWLAYQ
jgi:hypothetical protein